MSNPIVVLKFGSSVLADEAALPTVVLEIYREIRRGRRVVGVVSAFGDTTDNLINKANALCEDPDPACLARLLESDETTTIDLRGIPLAPGEEARIVSELGQGEVQARLSALGPSEIVETRFPGVWLVTHYNSENEVIGKFIEVCKMPQILKAQTEDIREGLAQLTAHLA